MATKHTPDYSVVMRDDAGRTVRLSINGANIDEMVAEGYRRDDAVESVEGNQFANAIARGEIGADAWMVPA
jgi:hypothetical protein